MNACAAMMQMGAVESNDPQLLTMWARGLILRGRDDEARATLARAQQIAPTCASVHVEYAYLALRMGDTVGALQHFEAAYAIEVAGAPWVIRWLEMLVQYGRFEQARTVADAYCAEVPWDGNGWFWLGYARHQLGEIGGAVAAYETSSQLQPDRAMLNSNLAAGYLQLENYDRTKTYLDKALAEEPNNALAWTNAATYYLKTRDVFKAECAIERALTLDGNSVIALQAKSNIHKEAGQWLDAIRTIEYALRLKPGDPSLEWSLAMLELVHGNYASGWIHHERRWNSPELRGKYPNLPVPIWQGESLAGKTLLVWSEQGYGDVLQFVRFVPELVKYARDQGGKVEFITFEPLVSLITRSLNGSIQSVRPSTLTVLPPCDFHLPLASTPLRLNKDIDHLSGVESYLKPDPKKVAASKRLIKPHAKDLKVGLVWTGSRGHQRNVLRSVDPRAYARMFSTLQDVAFFSLQKDAAADVRAMRGLGLHVVDHTDGFESFDDTAAYLKNLDLVITVCTAVAHLAGGMGIPTWLLLDVNPHWVWMMQGDESPWYPSVKLYRQEAYGEWESVLQRVATDLAHRSSDRLDVARACEAVHAMGEV